MLACARTTHAVVCLLRKEGYFSLCYLDDFVGVESSQDRAAEAYARFNSFAEQLGLTLALDKCTPPTQSITWLDFMIDSVNMSVTVSIAKFQEVVDECKLWSKKTKAMHKQFQFLAGKLKHLLRAIKLSVRFSNRVLAALKATPFLGSHVFNPELLQDLE